MDIRSWKQVVLQWITECGFMDRTYLNIEQSDIDGFYRNFSLQHKKTVAIEKYKCLRDFVNDFYPGFEINFDDENCLSSADYVYVYSLLLHFSCVKYPQTAFHEICQRLPDFSQQCIAIFFKKLLDTDPITKETLRHAIAGVANAQVTPPRLNDSLSSSITSVSVGASSSVSLSQSETPSTTPQRSIKPQRISPPTPKSFLLEERTRELYNLRAQLETERYEKGLLELQIKQNEDEIKKLNNDHKRLLQQIQDLKNELLLKTTESSTDCEGADSQIQNRILKELSQKEQEMIKLSENLRTLREEKAFTEEKLKYAEKEMRLSKNRIRDMDAKINELITDLKQKDCQIQYLTDSKIELEQFISETRSSSGVNPDLNVSADCLDNSFVRNINNTLGSNSLSSPENLGVSVVDVQLREKEHENQILKEELKTIQVQYKRLAKHVTKLTEEFDLPLDTSSRCSSDDSEQENEEEQSEKESSSDDQASYEDQINIFNTCMEKINKFHKTERNKIKQLSQKSESLQEENEDLSRKLSELTDQIEELKDKHTTQEKLQQELRTSKVKLESIIEKSQSDLILSEKQKNKLYNEVMSLQNDNVKLHENIRQLKAELDLQQEESRSLLANNKTLSESEQKLKTQLDELQKEFASKTLKWEEDIKQMSEKMAQQLVDIEMFRQTEQAIKLNYEQVVIKNEELKREARHANSHLCDIRKQLEQKENQLASLGEEIETFKKRDESLERNISNLIEEHKKEMLINSNAQSELDEQLANAKNRLAEAELLIKTKQHEYELKEQSLEDLRTKVNRILKLFIDHNKLDDSINLDNIDEIETHFRDIFGNSENLNMKVIHLQRSLTEVLAKVKQLTQELQEKSYDLEKSQEDILRLTADNILYENTIEKLKQEQICILEKSKLDLLKNEQELQNSLREASSQYEASMERIAVELKSEKEHHNNKEKELVLTKAENNEAKKKLKAAQTQIENLRSHNRELQQKCERLKQYESRVMECSLENDKLRHEIEAFKQQVTQNALRLLEADKALAEFVEFTKEQDTAKSEVELLQNKLKEKENLLTTIELKCQDQSKCKDQLQQLKQRLIGQNDTISAMKEHVQKLAKDKEHLTKESKEKNQQILKEQKDKRMLLSSLEKSTDQLKLVAEEKQHQTAYLEQKLQNLKEQYDSLTLQHTKLQGDFLEREAELRLSLDEQQQQKEDFEKKLASELEKISEKSEKLISIDVSLLEIIAIIENNFKLNHELLPDDIINVFNYQENANERNTQNLRKLLNHILLKHQNLNADLKELTAQNEEAKMSVADLKKSKNELMAKVNQQEKSLRTLQEQLENQEQVVENRVFREVKHLKEDLENLEKVNERLADENIKLQDSLGAVEEELKDSKVKVELLEKEALKLKEDIRNKSLQIEKLQQEEKNLHHTLKEKSQQIDRSAEKYKNLEIQLKDKNGKLQNLDKECQELKEKANKNQQKLSHYQLSCQSQQTEQKKLQEKLKLLQTFIDSMEVEVSNKNKEILVVKSKNAEILKQYKDQEEELTLISKKLDEMLTNKLNAETKCEQLQSEVQQFTRELEFTKAQQQSQQEDNVRLSEEINSLKIDKQHLREEIFENKQSLQRANENLTQLIQQISSIRLEKEAALEESLLLRKQLEETGKNQTTSETKMKCIMEKSQDLERKLLSTENELRSLRASFEKSENCTEKLQGENRKLRDNQEASTKRIEKLALKLGDSQAKSAKLERDNEKLCRTLENHAATVEALQKEKDILQSEAKTLKERLSRAERGHEQLAAKVKNLEQFNTSLQLIKQKLETCEIDSKTKINKLEKMREANEDKIRKLTNSLNTAESVNVKLNLEIGALNSQLQKFKVEHKQEHSLQFEELNQKIMESEELNHKFADTNEKLKLELSALKEENDLLNDQLSKATLSLEITSQKCESFAAEVEKLRSDMLILRQEKTQIEQQHEASMQKLTQFETRNSKLINENKNIVKSLEQKIVKLEEELTVKSKTVIDLQKEIEILKDKCECQTSIAQSNTAANLAELEDLRAKLSQAENHRLEQQQIISQLRLDNKILHTKYQESKQRALDTAKSCEERIRDNRLELEGKLEKMKNKMKTLYTEEITKMKTKQEREMAVVKSELEVLKTQNTKYEEHTRKLSNQIVRLNDNILQHQKENTILSTKLKHMTDQLHEYERNRRPTSIHVSTTSLAPVANTNIGPNLAMEDEEGEVFNNTYLTDLKNGRISELMSRDVCVEELKYRNSLVPPHLRSTYAAQFNHEFPEDDLKDGGPHSLDDSMSALLSTTFGGTRKKCSGVTHYKRPGPPTPSKNGGRLSFGGNSEPPREILKESCDSNTGSAVSSSKTPARFNFFASRFSMGAIKDETTSTKKNSDELNSVDLIENPKNRRIIAHKVLAGVGCTSTPRKSKAHYDQRRCLDKLMSSSSSSTPFIVTDKLVQRETKDVSTLETPVTALEKNDARKASVSRTIAKRLEAIAGGLRRSRRNSSMFVRRLSRRVQEICTPTSGETSSSALSTPAVAKDKTQTQVVISSSVTTSESTSQSSSFQRRLRKRRTIEKAARPSLYSRGNVFYKFRTPNKTVQHDLNRFKSRKQRIERFNKGRNIKSSRAERRKEDENEIDRTLSSKSVNGQLLEDTVVVPHSELNKQETEKEQFGYPYDVDFRSHCGLQEVYDDQTICRNKGGVAVKHDYLIQQELITSDDLENFDIFVMNSEATTENKTSDDNWSSRGSSEYFEKLLMGTASNAPFEVTHKPLHSTKCSHSHGSSCSHRISIFNRGHNSSCTHFHSHNNDNDRTNLTTPTPHPSPTNPTCQLSRTIYGSTLIYNHRLPNINTTYVRKSSIYIKNCKTSHRFSEPPLSCNDVVVITNETITLVDIMRMWSQMDSLTLIILSFALFASVTTLYSLFVSVCPRR